MSDEETCICPSCGAEFSVWASHPETGDDECPCCHETRLDYDLGKEEVDHGDSGTGKRPGAEDLPD